MKKVLYIMLLTYLIITCGSKQILAPLDAEDEFERAMLYYDENKYDKAIEGFERILFYHPSSEFVDDAQYWLARSYFQEGNYDQSILEFDYLIKNFVQSQFTEESYLYRAKAYYAKAPKYDKDPTEIENAIDLFNRFLTKFPNSKHINEARDLILSARNRLAKKELENGRLYLKMGEQEAALLYFSYVFTTYPETDMACEAKYLSANIYEKQKIYDKARALYTELKENENWQEKVKEKLDNLPQTQEEETDVKKKPEE